ncbi:translation initiation factor IF-2-like [Triticum urartu]|uniref:translation initiation factor IF-2-like n=1 Tax=Triticum urartu TaxID=4572 RepID=UPI0020435F15|nr:translation initiation factor IF-2-like [Triticum urartu]
MATMPRPLGAPLDSGGARGAATARDAPAAAMAAEAAFSAPLPVLPFPLPAPTATPAPADNSKSSSPLLGGSPNPPPASVLPTPASSRTGGSELPSEPLVSATTPEQLTLATAFRRGLLAKSRPDFLVRRPDPSSAPFMFTPGDALLHYVLENFSSPVFTPVAPGSTKSSPTQKWRRMTWRRTKLKTLKKRMQ